jgi:hypothetical protein
VANGSKAEFQRMVSEAINAMTRLAVQDSQDESPQGSSSSTDVEGDGNKIDTGVSSTSKQSSINEDISDYDQSNKKQASKKHEISVSLEKDGHITKKVKCDEGAMGKDARPLLHYRNSEPDKQDAEPGTKPAPSEPSEKQVDTGSSSGEIKGDSPSSSSDTSSRQCESLSSTSTLSNNQVTEQVAGQVRPMLHNAPACIIAIIRGDLTEVWCELTASIRTRSIRDGDFDEAISISKASSSGDSTDTETHARRTKELLICFRTITDSLKESGESNAPCRENEAGQPREEL